MDIIKNKEEKYSFTGISLSGVGTIESAVAVLDRNSKIIMLDKLFSMNDVKYFLDNLPGKKNALIMVSVPYNEVMISSKWKYNSRTYDLVNFDVEMKNTDDWTRRFSTRGSEYLKELIASGTDIFRYDTENIKGYFTPSGIYKERTPADCKSFQDNLRTKHGLSELPVNMLPVAQLEAVAGALFAKKIATENSFEYRKIGEFEGMPVLGV